MIERSPIPADGAAICAAIHSTGFHPEQVWDTDTFKTMLAAPLSRGEWITNAGDPVAFILWQHGPDDAEIYTLAVLPGARKRGYADTLLKNMEAAARADGLGRVILEVAADNEAAQALYKKHGYATINRRKNYYARADGAVDAIVMEKALKA